MQIPLAAITWSDFLTRLKTANSSLATYAIADWTPLTSDSAGQAILSDAIDERVTIDGDALGWAAADAKIATDAAAYLTATGPDASFVYFGDPDIAGHNCGATGTCYRTAIENTDRHIGTMLAGIRSRPIYADEDWTYIVTSDHGHTDAGGHGGNTPQERASFIIQSGPGIAPATPAIQPKNVDIAATVLAHFGVAIDPAWALDGQVLGAESDDPFDSLVTKLQPRTDETGVPADVLGWTHTTPDGWTVDNSAMGTGGVTEWRGWSFTTDDFWTRTAPGQGREGIVRARGVFAVADSDEWADKAYTGTFNSKLTSPPYDVSGAGIAKIGFSSHYLKDGNETAAVLVSFDGGPARTVPTYAGDVAAKVEQLEVAVPSGAQRMTVTWSLTKGNNNWYWAVDDPKVTKAPPPVASGNSYEIVTEYTGQLVDLPSATARRGAQLVQHPRSGAATQRWHFTGRPDGTFRIKNERTGLCVDVADSSANSGAPVIQAKCRDAASQRWRVGLAGGARYTLISATCGLVVTVAGPADDDRLIQAVGADTPAQRWTFVPQ